MQPVIEEPSKLFRVERIRGIKGNPYWERRLLREFGLMEVKIQTIFYFKSNHVQLDLKL